MSGVKRYNANNGLKKSMAQQWEFGSQLSTKKSVLNSALCCRVWLMREWNDVIDDGCWPDEQSIHRDIS